MEIRAAKSAEIPKIIARVKALGLDAERPAEGRWFVAVEGEALLAFGRLRAFPGGLELCSLGVEEAARGRGLGRQLAERLCGEACGQDLHLATVLSSFFEKIGFSEDPAPPKALRDKIAVCGHCAGHENARILRRVAC